MANRTFLIPVICEKLLTLVPLIQKIVIENDFDRISKLCMIFVEAIESYTVLIIDEYDNFDKLINILVLFTDCKDLAIVSQTLPAWNTLFNEINTKHGKKISKDIFLNFLKIVVLHLKFPINEGDQTAMKKDEFREFRHDIGDCLKNACYLLGSTKAISVPCELLKSNIHKYLNIQQIDQANQVVLWQEIEASIFAFRTMASEIDPNESEKMNEVISILLNLPPQVITVPRVRYSTILAIGAFAEWLKFHPQFIMPSFAVVMDGLGYSESFAAAVLSFKHICQSCSKVS